ncbi:MAG TPA: adenosine-specific kinase [Candidatus Hydrothermia bacterium]|nr:adenosine-specific kinase [Candidatus Hydrothermia bacterium]
MLTFDVVEIQKPDEINVILGQSHFIKTVEDIEEIIVTSVPGVKFALAFCESSGPRLIRYAGNDEILTKLAIENAKNVGAGHFFIILLHRAYPINILNALKQCQEVANIYAASANPLEVVVAQTENGRGVLGVIDGQTPLGVETAEDAKNRYEFLRKIGYKK